MLTIIRDTIFVDQTLYNALIPNVSPGDTLRLVARRVEIAAGFVFDLDGRVLQVYSSTFVGNGSEIRSIGRAGTNGARGSDGVSGVKGGNVGQAGTPGTAGGNGTDGTDGGVIEITAQTVDGLYINSHGGAGGNGGDGGFGGNGGDRVYIGPKTSPMGLADGANGGDGGAGGRGGAGGKVTIRVTAPLMSDPIVNANPGPSGRPGTGGKGGWHGAAGRAVQTPRPPHPGLGRGGGRPPLDEEVSIVWGSPPPGHVWELPGRYYQPAHDGVTPSILPPRDGGMDDLSIISEERYWATVRQLDFAPAWAAHRRDMGTWYFRGYIPGDPTRSDYLKLAVAEFTVSLALLPASDPMIDDRHRYREYIWKGFNVLGLPRDLDVVPDFTAYNREWSDAIDLSFHILDIGFDKLGQASALMLGAEDMQRVITETSTRQNRVKAELDDADNVSNQLTEQIKTLDGRIVGIKVRIAEAEQQITKQNREIKVKEVVGDVIAVGKAVIAVAGAVETGGASLMLLAPDVLTLAETVYDNFDPIAAAIFSAGDPAVLDDVKEKFKTVGKEWDKAGDDINKGKEAVVSLVNLIKRLKTGKTANNSKVVSLVTEAAELVRQRLLALQALQRNFLLSQGLAATWRGEAEALNLGMALKAKMQKGSGANRDAGLQFIHLVQTQADRLLKLSFYAQRAVEIYTLQDLSRSVRYDCGFVHPDLEAKYRDGLEGVNDNDLVTAYGYSWGQALSAVALSESYEDFFKNGPHSDLYVMTVRGAEDIALFQRTNHLSFELEPTDFPKQRYQVKIRSVYVSFVGAKSANGNVISVRVDHGSRYTEKLADGTIKDPVLKANFTIAQAPLVKLSPSPEMDNDHPALEFWRRGVCGWWDLSILEWVLEHNKPDFSDLTAIEVWIAYQFFE